MNGFLETIQMLKYMMLYNDWENDELSKGDAKEAIASCPTSAIEEVK